MRQPRMKDIAKAANVSAMTVSRAFKDDASVRKETRELIRRTAQDMGYVFDTTASNLRSKRSDFIAVTIPSINNANFADTVRALSDALSAAGLQVLLGYSNYDVNEEERLIEQLLRRRPAAIVITGGHHTPRARQLLASAGIPVIEMWDLPENPIGHVVGFSNAAATRTMIKHLTSAGYQRIAFIGGDSEGDTRGAHRRRGFVDAMAAKWLDTHRLIDTGPPPISMREGAAAMATLLERYPDTEAVVCVSDLSAFGALTECMRRGVRVPQDIGIAGFGAYEVAAVSVPAITTTDPFPLEIGHKVAELLARILQSAEASASPELIEIDPEVRPGGSTAPLERN